MQTFLVLHFLGKPSSVFEKDNPDWAPSQNFGYDYNKVTESNRESYNLVQEKVEKRPVSEGAIALMALSRTTIEEIMVNVEELNCKACQTDTTAVYLTELMENVETLKKENAARKEQTKAGKLRCVIFPPFLR